MKKNDTDTQTKKNKTTTKGRHGSARRPHRKEVYFSDQEFERVQELAKEASAASLPEFIRHIVMHHGVVKAALTPDERKLITDLGRIGTNIWEFRKDLMKHGPDSQLLKDLETMYREFTDIKEYYKKMIKK